MFWRRRIRLEPWEMDCGLPESEVAALAMYNAERWRGVTHSPAWSEAMAVLQARFDAAAERRMERYRMEGRAL